ncbi:organic cation transporter protein isoform X1 [Patella vulgata]|uniref:organic cation transporter protein isoform X1 n=2 Tax=Patella vulgata TaxID=6465 RepID=UPI00217FBEAE|nr:organic cation transporter protein isoform X1 [Patella vulgata]
MDVDTKLESLGKCGCYQALLFVSLSLIYLRGAWHVFVPVFIAADPGHTCNLPPKTSGNINNSFIIPYSNNSGLFDNASDSYLARASACSVTYYSDTGDNMSRTCDHGWKYGDQFDSTIVTQFNLVCDDDYKAELSTTIYMIGTAIGAVSLTYFSDRFGRKKLLIVCLILQGAIGVGVAFVQSYIIFTILRFFIGLLNMGIGLTAFVMITEAYPASVRTIPSVAVQVFWAIGIMFLALFGYLVRNWSYLEILISVPNFLIVLYIFFIPESIPWLMATNNHQQANAVIDWAMKINKITHQKHLHRNPFKEIVQMIPEEEEEKGDESVIKSILRLFRTKKIRLYTIVIIYLYIVNSLVYMGISFSMPSLHGNIYLNLFLSGLVEIPAQIICMFVITRIGRRIPLMAFLLLCGISTIGGAVCPVSTDNGTSLIWLKITFFMISKFAITGSYSTVYLYSAEIFPTVVRNLAMGIASGFENLGSICAPFIMYASKRIPILPVVIFSSASIIGCFLIMLLPETNNQPLPQTVSETYKPRFKDRNSQMSTEL